MYDMKEPVLDHLEELNREKKVRGPQIASFYSALQSDLYSSNLLGD